MANHTILQQAYIKKIIPGRRPCLEAEKHRWKRYGTGQARPQLGRPLHHPRCIGPRHLQVGASRWHPPPQNLEWERPQKILLITISILIIRNIGALITSTTCSEGQTPSPSLRLSDHCMIETS
ncbi:hypothetical protein AXF42_Ash003393 [Apostasia shenzhenica]|uniref:Uncharacterized protein n=1 Tax=Apostasia shenzhenica TaxID=1088818 RepID=A0A2I0BG14_9ASPA|nr:hypothetical protein AXF42_Ash003393 [Apostasia shenzhenica]